SHDGQVTGVHGTLDVTDWWVMKTDGNGNLIWQKAIGGSDSEGATSAIQLADGSFLIAGWSGSQDGDIPGNHGDADFAIIRLDAGGNIIPGSAKSFGGTGTEILTTMLAAPDGGYLLSGSSNTNPDNGDVTGNHGQRDLWLVKLDAAYNLVWQKCVGTPFIELSYDACIATDGLPGYLICGFTVGDHTLHNGSQDFILAKTDLNGNVLWQKQLGSNADDASHAIAANADGGFMVAGFAGDANGDFTTATHGERDLCVIKFIPPIAFIYTPNPEQCFTCRCRDIHIPVHIKSPAGIATIGPPAPRIFYRHGTSGPFLNTGGTLVSGNNKDGNWDFVISPHLMGCPAKNSDIYYYFVAKEASSPVVISNPGGGSFSATPPTLNRFTLAGNCAAGPLDWIFCILKYWPYGLFLIILGLGGWVLVRRRN
ncbi:MAG TPA: hypothetical protein VG603_10520, partial [Chitinophagales bacterium]|nr:hypothetical protein [Chitinophagales bacterium]